MSVTDFNEINDGRSSREEFQPDGTTVRTHVRSFRVHTNDNDDDGIVILAFASSPKIGASHPNDTKAKCIRRTPAPMSAEQKQQWILTVEYSTKWDIAENPLDDPPLTEWSTESYQMPVFEEIDGNAIINSAGDPFDPPAEKDDSRWTSVTRRNVTNAVPPWIFAYQDAVNSDAYTVDGKLIAAGEAKISAIHLSEPQERNDIEYRVLTITTHYRGEGDDAGSSGYGSGSGADEIEPWDLSILDAGMRELSSDSAGADLRNITNTGVGGDGEPVTAPVPLDGDGQKLDDPTPANAVFIQFEVYRRRTFATIEP